MHEASTIVSSAGPRVALALPPARVGHTIEEVAQGQHLGGGELHTGPPWENLGAEAGAARSPAARHPSDLSRPHVRGCGEARHLRLPGKHRERGTPRCLLAQVLNVRFWQVLNVRFLKRRSGTPGPVPESPRPSPSAASSRRAPLRRSRAWEGRRRVSVARPTPTRLPAVSGDSAPRTPRGFP